MNPFLTELLASVRLADVVDVLLLASFFFVGITWLRRSSSGSAVRRVTALGFLFALVYLLAHVFDLYLTAQLLEVLFFLVLITIALVFQGDIRRLLDRVANWTLTGRPASPHGASPVQTLVETVAHLAEHRTGALIAIRGSEAWGAHVQGGVSLDGRVSIPLLYSIFHPETPGHDGAVLMEGSRITRFAAHLPLAQRLPEASRFGGTRHAAALGLAEECDALVIVVSEERGTISVAHDGTLEVVSPAELAERLEAFWEEHYPAPEAMRGGFWNRRALETGAMSLGLAAFTWLLFSYSADTVTRSFEVPVEFRNLPTEWALEDDTVGAVRVTLSGSERAFSQLDPAALSVSFDLAEPEPGTNEFVIRESNLSLPPGLNLYDADPRELSVGVERLARLDLPVRVRTTGALPPPFDLVPDPRVVRVLVPARSTEVPGEIPTVPIDPSEIPPDGSLTAALALPPKVRLPPDQPGEVEVRLQRRPTREPR